MQPLSVLACWIGQADYRAMMAALPEDERPRYQGMVKKGPEPVGGGPIRSLLDHLSFDEVHLLANDRPDLAERYVRWLGGPVKLHLVDVPNPVDYARVFTVVDETLAAIMAEKGRPRELSIHLSPGTPAMTAVWVLLGKTRYPATFYQTHDGQVIPTEVPFDITLDVVPQLLRRPDTYLQHLAARAPQEVSGFERIAGDCPAIRLAVGRAQRAALRDVPVLILGESGTGKERFARAIHDASHRGRKGKPFLALNCAAMPRDLLEAELFGHSKNAFTGAVKDRPGLFESADGGTLFLDEVGECDPALQAKLLRVLQPVDGAGPCTRLVQRVGETRSRTVDVRVLAATNRDLHAAMREGRFREDLYYRLAVISIRLPALRERRSDVPALARELLAQINRDFHEQDPNYKDASLSSAAMQFLKRHDWPGNIRQLSNVVLQAAVMAETEQIDRVDLEAALAEMPAAPAALDEPIGEGFDLKKHLEAIQKRYLERAMHQAGNVKAQAARLLGYPNYQTLDSQLKRFGVQRAE